MIRAVIFDCFGVLVGQGFDATYARAGGDPAKDSLFIKDLLGAASVGAITQAQFVGRICEQLTITPKVWAATLQIMEQPDAELLEYIGKLRPQYKTAILSNANAGVLEGEFTPAQLNLFDVVVASAEVNLVKPQPEIYQLTADRLGVDTSECVFVDDIAGYCEAAKAVGMQAVHFQDFVSLKKDLAHILYQG